MNIKVQSIHFDADRKLLDFIDEKVGKLSQYYDDILDAEVFLKLDNNNTIENKIVEVKLNIPGKTLFASDQSKTFEQSVDESVDNLRRQVTKHKQKIRGL
jgi:putative sigma-54 modulation protein